MQSTSAFSSFLSLSSRQSRETFSSHDSNFCKKKKEKSIQVLRGICWFTQSQIYRYGTMRQRLPTKRIKVHRKMSEETKSDKYAYRIHYSRQHKTSQTSLSVSLTLGIDLMHVPCCICIKTIQCPTLNFIGQPTTKAKQKYKERSKPVCLELAHTRVENLFSSMRITNSAYLLFGFGTAVVIDPKRKDTHIRLTR